jgi:hypothetical protein
MKYVAGAPSRERHGQFPVVPSFALVGEPTLNAGYRPKADIREGGYVKSVECWQRAPSEGFLAKLTVARTFYNEDTAT